jgi:hypothetical protein
MKLSSFALSAIALVCLSAPISLYAAPLSQHQDARGQTTAQTPSASQGQTAYSSPYLLKGCQCYQERHYASAIEYLNYAIKNENVGAGAWLYLAHSQYSVGHLKDAIETYNKIKQQYPASPEAGVARTCLLKLDPNDSYNKEKDAPAPSADALSAQAGKAAEQTLLSRVKIGFWKQDHPPITAGIINTVKANIKSLPDPVKLILLKGGTKFIVCGALVDQVPSLSNREGRGYEGRTYKRCPGMFSNNTLFICQNLVNESTDMVEPPLPLTDVSQTFFHELGHALDSCGGRYSNTDEYKHAYWLDLARIPDDAAGRLSYYMQKSVAGQSESCAEITAVILGGADRYAADIRTYFPLTMAYLKKKLNMP